MDTYIEDYKWESDTNIQFRLSNGKVLKYEYVKPSCESCRHYLRNINGDFNRKLFDYLGIEDPYKWVENVVGYEIGRCGWPEVKSKADVKITVGALLEYNNPKYTIKKDFIVDDYPALPSEVASFYSKDKTEVIFKELDVTYHLHTTSSGIWWHPNAEVNTRHENYIFTQLKIKNKNKWVEDILGYRPGGGIGELAFPEAKTKEDAYKVMDALIAEYIKQFKLKTTVNYGDSKIKLRRKKADVRIGDCPAGSIVYGKRGKTSVRCRRISYQTCIGS